MSSIFGSSLAVLTLALCTLSTTTGRIQWAKWTQDRNTVVEAHAATLFAPQLGMQLLARLSEPTADEDRTYSPMLAARTDDTRATPLPSNIAEDLEAVEAYRPLAAAALLRGQTQLAASYLDLSPNSADTKSDRSALALSEGHPKEALRWANAAIDEAPDHRQAWWNRAVALRTLGLDLTAAKAWTRVFELEASKEDPSQKWGAKSRALADELERRAHNLRLGWQEAHAAGRALVVDRTPIEPRLVSSQSGLIRAYFYEALWSATSRKEVLELEPLAAQLDALSARNPSLTTTLENTARQNFRIRGPLSKRYRAIASGPSSLEPSTLDSYLKDLEAAGQDDLRLAAMRWTRPDALRLETFRRLAQKTHDPWLSVLADIREAEVARTDGDFERAEIAFLRALDHTTFQYRKLQIELRLIRLYVTHHRLADAEALLGPSMDRALATRDWRHYVQLLQYRGRMALFARKPDLSRAVFDEITLYETDATCEITEFVGAHRAMLELYERRPEAARSTLKDLPVCQTTPRTLATLGRVDAYRQVGTPDERVQLETELERKIARPSSEIDLAFSVVAQARAFAPRDRQNGLQTIEATVKKLKGLDNPSQAPLVQRALAYAYATLISESAATRDFDRSLAYFAEEIDTPLPDRCVLGVQLDDERRVVTYRDAEGTTNGFFDDTWDVAESKLDPAQVVPKPVIDRLGSCDEIAVLGRPPLTGEATLMPPENAWYYLVKAPSSPLPPAPAANRLVVSDVRLGFKERMAPLPRYTPKRDDVPLVHLTHRDATQASILESMAWATEIELFTHGWYDAASPKAAALVVSPNPGEPQGRLTAEDVSRVKLNGHPIVMLAACSAAGHTGFRHAFWNLPTAFVQSGARAVFAPTTELPADGGRVLIDELRHEIRSGQTPSQALRAARMKRQGTPLEPWASRMIVFQSS